MAEQIGINTIRTLSIDLIEKANSGHPGLPLGAAPMAYSLWQNHMNHDPLHPDWINRDRFVLSAGHGSALLYSLLHLYGYDLTIEDLKNFRQYKSKTPGHPEFKHTAGVEATTGPLGQGFTNAVGMAMAERKLAHLWNRPGFEVIDHFTYALVSDGDLMEGVTAEAASLAGHLKLGKLILLYDCNHISLDGPTSLTFSTENVRMRFESYGWQVIEVKDGDQDVRSIDNAIAASRKDILRPSLIIVNTTIGFGSPKKQGTSSVHGSPLGKDELAATKKQLGFDPAASFVVPQAARDLFSAAAKKGAETHRQWRSLFSNYEKEFPTLAQDLLRTLEGSLPTGWDQNLPTFAVGDDSATRASSGKVIQKIASSLPEFFGGDADLSVSTSTSIQGAGSFDGVTGAGKNVHYGVREHAMAAIANGMAYHGGVRHFVATFFCFADYMRPAIRLASMNHLPVVYVWTHDSIGLGEDGPTHQPVEQLASLRSMPGLVTIRPCDANEVREAWIAAIENTQGPTGLVLSRQKLKTLDRTALGSEKGLKKGAYVLSPEAGKLRVALIATGSEVALALDVQKKLQAQGVPTRVVSFPSWELFARQPASYQQEVLGDLGSTVRVSIEAGSSFGWDRWIGPNGIAIAVDTFGLSAPDSKCFEEFGMTPEVVTQRILKKLG